MVARQFTAEIGDQPGYRIGQLLIRIASCACGYSASASDDLPVSDSTMPRLWRLDASDTCGKW